MPIPLNLDVNYFILSVFLRGIFRLEFRYQFNLNLNKNWKGGKPGRNSKLCRLCMKWVSVRTVSLNQTFMEPEEGKKWLLWVMRSFQTLEALTCSSFSIFGLLLFFLNHWRWKPGPIGLLAQPFDLKQTKA